MAAKTPLAFLSYAHSDDTHENGKLRLFAERLRGEVRLQWGEDFPIFIDRNDLKWGQEWKSRIDQSLDDVTFLIPILTPGYFKSEWCRKECMRFLERESELKRNDLILPVYYVSSLVLEDSAKRDDDELAQTLQQRQYKDWRNFRHEPWTTPEVARQFEQMALQIVEALQRANPAPLVAISKAMAATQSHVSESTVPTPLKSANEIKSAPNEPHTVVVDALHRGNYTTITAAIQREPAGTRILVRPGNYHEAIVIDKPLEILGEGNRDDIVLQTSVSDTLVFRASMGRVANLTLRQTGGGDGDAVDIIQGRLDIEECDISSQGRAAIAIHGGADPRIRRNCIHNGTSNGIFVYESGAGLIEDNEIFGNTLAGIAIETGANPTVRKNRIHDGKASGIFVYENGAGLIEDMRYLRILGQAF